AKQTRLSAAAMVPAAAGLIGAVRHDRDSRSVKAGILLVTQQVAERRSLRRQASTHWAIADGVEPSRSVSCDAGV
ncbi:MAG TPA: hypothetical protein VGJ91_00720, partial [Polyangiaceae bacterium]